MPNVLSDLEVKEVSLVDRPACAEVDPATGQKVARARVALVKRDEPVAKGVKYLVSGKDTGNHLPYTGPDGKPDHHLMGGAWAALTSTYRGKPYEGPDKEAALARLKRIYEQEGMDTPGSTQKGDHMTLEQTLADVQKKLADQDGLIAAQKKQLDAITAEKAEVEKMSKKYKAAFGGMTQKEKDEYMAADAEKRKSIMDAKCKAMDDEEEAEKRKRSGEPAEKSDLQKAEDSFLSEIAKRDARITKAEAELAAIKKQERLNTFIAKAEAELPHTPGSRVEKGTDLMTIADAMGGENTEAFKRHIEKMKAADAILGSHMVEFGKFGGDSNSVEGQLMAKSDEIAKRDKVSKSVAYGRAIRENPELYAQAMKEEGARA